MSYNTLYSYHNLRDVKEKKGEEIINYSLCALNTPTKWEIKINGAHLVWRRAYCGMDGIQRAGRISLVRRAPVAAACYDFHMLCRMRYVMACMK